jgi:hypothetical protein
VAGEVEGLRVRAMLSPSLERASGVMPRPSRQRCKAPSPPGDLERLAELSLTGEDQPRLREPVRALTVSSIHPPRS